MRRLLTLFDSALFLVLTSTAWAHEEISPDELGHHWDMPAYRGELHFQLVMMAAITCVLVLAPLVIRAHRKRGNQR